VLAKVLEGVKFFRPGQCFSFCNGFTEALPWDHAMDGSKRVLLVRPGSDQSGSDARVEANLLVDGTGIRLEGTSMPSFGLAEDPADQAVEKIDRLVGQAGGEIQGDGHKCRMPALPLETSDMLNGGFVSLACELAQACLVDQMSAAGIDADRANMFQAFNHAEHGGCAVV
jgi:hypothetical protein